MQRQPYRALEFFSGIGGWSYALKHLALEYEILSAFDINVQANQTYKVNHGLTPSAQSIVSLSSEYLDSFNANLWMMSPPCQPFTRNNQTESRDDNDQRSQPFLHLIDQLKSMNKKPLFIALENVVGFEESNCCSLFLASLSSLNYSYIQFHLNPLEFGIPNSRPRYYCLAQLNSTRLDLFPSTNTIYTSIPNLLQRSPKQLKYYLQFDLSTEELNKYQIPMKLLNSSAAWCFDVRNYQSTYTSCYTKSYSRFVKGTGSILLYNQVDPTDESFMTTEMNKFLSQETHDTREFNSNWWDDLQSVSSKQLSLRYLTPRELLSLFGFPDDSFIFPADISLRKRYELIGNSINVTVVSELLRYLLISTEES